MTKMNHFCIKIVVLDNTIEISNKNFDIHSFNLESLLTTFLRYICCVPLSEVLVKELLNLINHGIPYKKYRIFYENPQVKIYIKGF